MSDEQPFIVGYDRGSRIGDFGFRAIFSEHVELQSVCDAASAGLHIDNTVFVDVATVFKLLLRGDADQSFNEFGPDAASVLDQPERRRPNDQFRARRQHDAGAHVAQFY
jgi:hypothetical protein